MPRLLISIALVLTAQLTWATPLDAAALSGTPRVVALSDDAACQAFRRWFTAQPGGQLVMSASSAFNATYARPRKPDNILDYSTIPMSNDASSWYKGMKHYRTTVGSTRCASASYDPAHKTVLVLSDSGTGSDFTITIVSNPPAELPIQTTPKQTRNGVRLGMTIAQVQAIEGSGTLRQDGRYQRLMYSQNYKKGAAEITSYLGFLFAGGKLVAMNVGGGV